MKFQTSLKTLAIACFAVGTLAACGGGGGSEFTAPTTGVVTPTPPPPPPPPPPPEPDETPQFLAGAGFNDAFNQVKTDEAVEPAVGDIIALDKTAEPIPIPNP